MKPVRLLCYVLVVLTVHNVQWHSYCMWSWNLDCLVLRRANRSTLRKTSQKRTIKNLSFSSGSCKSLTRPWYFCFVWLSRLAGHVSFQEIQNLLFAAPLFFYSRVWLLSIPLFLTLQAKEATKKPTKAKAAEALPTKEPAKKGKRAKAAAVISSSDEDSDSVSKKPAAVKKTKISKVLVPRHPLLQSTANGLIGLCHEIYQNSSIRNRHQIEGNIK